MARACPAEQTGDLQARRHFKLQHHGYPSLAHTVMLRRAKGRVLAMDATLVERHHKIRSLMNSVSLSGLTHPTVDGTPLTLMSARKQAKAIGTSDFRLKKYGHSIRE